MSNSVILKCQTYHLGVEFELVLLWSSGTWNMWRIHTCIECTFLAPFDASLYWSFWRLKSLPSKFILKCWYL